MTRSHLLGAASAAVFACLSTGALAQSVINGGGSTLAQFDYGNGSPNNTPGTTEYGLYNATSPSATIGTYWEAGFGHWPSPLSFADDLSCDISKAQTGTMTCTGYTGTPANDVDYGASDATLSSTQISTWSTATLGQAQAGNLIQLPSMGVAVSIPVNDTKLKKNYKLVVNDDDLCGIFSGKLTNFSQLSGFSKAKIAAGPFTVVYRSDGSGTTFLLTNHLADPNVCTSANTAAGFTFTATTSFAGLFPGGLPAQFLGESGSSGVANTMAGLNTGVGALPQAIGYLSPDFTSVDSGTSNAVLSNGKPSPLLVAAVTSGAVSKGTPTTANITKALAAPVDGQFLNPPSTASQAANPAAYVPLIQTVKKGYPIVGYTTFDFAQCYNDPKISASILAFLNDHYTVTAYTTVQKNNGFVSVSKSGAAKFLQAITNNILTNKSGFNTNIGNATACAGKAGR